MGFKPLDFKTLEEANESRVKRWHGENWQEDGWTGGDWANAMQGEAGEAGNIVKKLRRIEAGLQGNQGLTEHDLLDMLSKEIGDTLIYLDLLAQRYDLSLAGCARYAFNQVSEREGFPERI